MKYLIALVLLAGCGGSPQPYTAYMNLCGTNSAVTLQTGHNAILQPTSAYVKVCGGTSPATSSIVMRSVASPTCGFTVDASNNIVAFDQALSSDWVACP
jgi:hypothetical protein